MKRKRRKDPFGLVGDLFEMVWGWLLRDRF